MGLWLQKLRNQEQGRTTTMNTFKLRITMFPTHSRMNKMKGNDVIEGSVQFAVPCHGSRVPKGSVPCEETVAAEWVLACHHLSEESFTATRGRRHQSHSQWATKVGSGFQPMLPRHIAAKCSLYAHLYTDEGKSEGGLNVADKKNR
jgi:hypothetical protein